MNRIRRRRGRWLAGGPVIAAFLIGVVCSQAARGQATGQATPGPAPTAQASSPDKVVLKVGDTSITQREVERTIQGLAPQLQRNLAAQGRRPLGDEFVKLLVLSEEALRQHLDSTPDFKELLALSRLKILAEQEYQEIVRRAVVTPEETSKYYADHQSDFDAVQVLQVVVRKKPEGAKEGIPGFTPEEAKARAEEIHKAFVAGDDPKKIADKYRMENFVRVDEQPYAVRRGSMRADMEKATFELKPGQVTDVYDLGQALVFVKVVSHQAEELKNVSARIENTLRQQKINAALETLKQNSKVWMDDAYFSAPAGAPAQPKPPAAVVAPATAAPK